MSTRSPRRVEQLYFLLRREPTVRTAENLERRCSLSLSLKISNCPATAPLSSYYMFLCSIFGEEDCSHFCLIQLKIPIIPNVSFFLIFDTWHNLGHPSHPLSNLATCVTRVHVVGDFCHITCISNLFYGTRYLVSRKT